MAPGPAQVFTNCTVLYHLAEDTFPILHSPFSSGPPQVPWPARTVLFPGFVAVGLTVLVLAVTVLMFAFVSVSVMMRLLV